MSFTGPETKLYALRYSHSQKVFHRSTLQSAINDGLNSIRGHRPPSDWILVGIASNPDDLLKLGQQLRAEEAGTSPKEERLPAEE